MDVADVEELLRINMGDPGRLNHIRSKLQDGKDLYSSDKKYLQHLLQRYCEYVAEEPPTPPASEPEAQTKPPRAGRKEDVAIINQTRHPTSTRYSVGIAIGAVIWVMAVIGAVSGHFGVAFWIWVVGLAIILLSRRSYKNTKKKARMRALVRFGAEDMDYMSGVQFEELLAAVFSTLGYAIFFTPTTGDFGADLILTTDGKKIAVQAKRHSNNVGNKAVQEVVAGAIHYGADDAWVVTNTWFTSGAVKQAKSAGVVLVDRDGLVKCIVRANDIIEEEESSNTC